jgi:hypothetical protein
MRKFDNAYALIIGVDYKKETKTVERDAKAIKDVLVDQKLCGYQEENITLLIGKDATMQGIFDALDVIISKTNESSSFLFYYSGHGGYEKESGTSWLCPYDKADTIYITGKELRDKFSQIKSKRMFILFDSCHSGSFFDGKDDVISETISKNTKQVINSQSSTLEGLAQEIDDEQGMVIVASCQANELSWGDSEDEHSVFTQSLIEAFKAVNLKHKQYLADEYVRTIEAVNYVFERTPELFKILKERGKLKQKMQTPYANLQMSTDFAICYIPEELKQKIATNKFKKRKQVEPKNTSDASWERLDGNNLLLFVHGLSAESQNTFGKIPEMLQSDSNFDGWAMKSLGYSSVAEPKLGKEIWGAIRDIDKLSGNLRASINHKFKNYDRIAIVAHSIGGLIVQKTILDLDEDTKNRISHLIMFGTPSNGISPEILKKQWNTKYVEMSSDGDFIKSLREEWNTTFNGTYPFKLKVATSTEDEYVTLESCHGPFDKKYCEFVEGKHIDMVKPKSDKDISYSLILSTLTGSKFFKDYKNKEEINLVLGKYDAVVKNLLPKKEDLDKNGLTQLIFALEGLERKEEVYEILNSHPIAKDNTDLMGIIGGRHKRDYLKTSSYKSYTLSHEYYSKALAISIEDESHNQVYYHAINLAFLSIVSDSETGKGKMKRFAKQALEAAEKSDDNIWKFATVAEAKMYLEDFETSKAFYIKASEGFSIREKVSMYTNANAGYTALTKKDNDEFIQFLKDQLLN